MVKNRLIIGYNFTVLFINSLTLLWLSNFASAAPPATAVPLPCAESLALFPSNTNHFSVCKNQMGTCGKLPSYSGYISELTDSLIRTTVGEIQNIYKGSDPWSTGSTLSKLRPSEVLGANPTGAGPCTTVGACNLFCGEGYQEGVVATLPSEPAQSSQGYLPNGQATSMFTGIPSRYSDADFQAKGVIQSISAPNPAPSPPGGGWPTFTLADADHLNGSGSLCGDAPGDQTTLTQTGFHNSPNGGSDQLPLNVHFLISSITWPDSTFANSSSNSNSSNTGNNECHIVSASDFTNASGVAALQTGALVQAFWMTLNDVTSEIKNNYLNSNSPKCDPLRTQYLADLGTSVETIYSFAATSACSAVPDGCTQSILDQTTLSSSNPADTAANTTVGISACPLSALLLRLKATALTNLAACEVNERARILFDSAFSTPASSIAWSNQLRNYAIAGCMNRQAPFSGDNYCQLDLDEISVFAMNTFAAGLTLGGYDSAAEIGSIGQSTPFYQVDRNSPYLSSALNGKTYGDVQNAINPLYTTNVASCFPYTYSSALYAYLTNKAPIPFKQVTIQGPGSGTYTSPSGKITITGCKMTDKTNPISTSH